MSMDKTSSPETSAKSSNDGVSRREFVERLRRASLVAAPAVAAIALSAPKVSAGY